MIVFVGFGGTLVLIVEMAWRTYNDSNEEMVKNFKQMSIISSKQVEDAFLNVPRAAFLPEFLHDEAYADYPVRGDDHLHMSAPHMYATVLEALNMKEGMLIQLKFPSPVYNSSR